MHTDPPVGVHDGKRNQELDCEATQPQDPRARVDDPAGCPAQRVRAALAVVGGFDPHTSLSLNS